MRPTGMPSLTRQLLAFSRKQVLTLELLNLNGIVVEMQSMLPSASSGRTSS